MHRNWKKNGIIKISAMKNTIEIVVWEDGTGISREHLSNLFEPFNITKKKETWIGGTY